MKKSALAKPGAKWHKIEASE